MRVEPSKLVESWGRNRIYLARREVNRVPVVTF